MSDDDLIPVCSKCLMASCWQGAFMCEESENGGIIWKRRDELKALALEHPSYWKTSEELEAQ